MNAFDYFIFFNVCATFTTTFRIFGKPFWGNSIFGKHIYNKQHTLKTSIDIEKLFGFTLFFF